MALSLAEISRTASSERSVGVSREGAVLWCVSRALTLLTAVILGWRLKDKKVRPPKLHSRAGLPLNVAATSLVPRRPCGAGTCSQREGHASFGLRAVGNLPHSGGGGVVCRRRHPCDPRLLALPRDPGHHRRGLASVARSRPAARAHASWRTAAALGTAPVHHC